MNAKIIRGIGIILLLLFLRSAYSLMTLGIRLGEYSQFTFMLVTRGISALAFTICGVILTARGNIKAACNAAGGSFIALGVYYIISSVTVMPRISSLMSTPDTQLPGLNALGSLMMQLSVTLTLINAALHIAGGALGIIFMNKGKCFVQAVFFLTLPVIFALAVEKTVPVMWILFLTAVIYTKRTQVVVPEENELP